MAPDGIAERALTLPPDTDHVLRPGRGSLRTMALVRATEAWGSHFGRAVVDVLNALCLPRSTARIWRVVAVVVPAALGHSYMRIVLLSVYPIPRLARIFSASEGSPVGIPFFRDVERGGMWG
jgi:hypothetical protein